MRSLFAAFAAAATLLGTFAAKGASLTPKPTIVLVHGAFADSTSWSGVISRLEHDGYPVIAAANPLRGVRSDAASVATLVRSVRGRIVLVGHSYGGPVITEAAQGNVDVVALVYVAGFLPLPGESSLSLSRQFPGSTLGDTLESVSLADGDEDLYISRPKFRAQFAADVPPAVAAIMAATQRPVTLSALGEPSTVSTWKSLPTYVVYGSADRNIPAAAMRFMGERAHARKIVEIPGASHAVMVSHPADVARLIEQAASGN
jgi:pimeloyl-ACP methyl ester carboxylesterase